MSQWKKFGLIAGVPSVLLCVACAAFFLQAESVSRLVFVFSFLTFGKAVYDLCKKEGEDKERVRASPELASLKPVSSYDPPSDALGVELYNAGRNPVSIKRVALVVRTDAGKVQEFMPCEDEAARSDRYFQEASTLPECVSRLEIGPNKHARFHLDRHTEWTVGRLLEQPGHSFWIVIESFIGEVARISGNEVQAALLNTRYGRAMARWKK
jgi:hypothetical protein